MSFKSLSVAVILALALSTSAQSPVYGQCGGIGWSGATTCAAGSTCTVSNAYYSQCLPGSANPTTAAPTTAAPTTTVKSTTTAPATTSPPGGSTGGSSSLNAKFVAHAGKVFWGTCADQNRLTVSQDAAITQADFGGVTPENSMKWDSIEPSRGSFSWAGPDYLVNWAVTNNKIIRGHTFIWGQQTPAWVTAINDAPTLTTVIQNHIAAVMGRYKGKLYAFDVINEHINEDGTIKSTHFTQVLGNNVFTIALQAARAADPNVKLYINDYNLDSNNAKVAGIVKLVKQLNGGGTKLVDGIGSQTHLGAGGAGGVQAALTALAAAGVDVAITELDIANASASDYQTVAKACVAVSACVSVTSWGVRDTDSWRASTNPLLFDANWQPKAAYNGILSVL